MRFGWTWRTASWRGEASILVCLSYWGCLHAQIHNPTMQSIHFVHTVYILICNSSQDYTYEKANGKSYLRDEGVHASSLQAEYYWRLLTVGLEHIPVISNNLDMDKWRTTKLQWDNHVHVNRLTEILLSLSCKRFNSRADWWCLCIESIPILAPQHNE